MREIEAKSEIVPLHHRQPKTQRRTTKDLTPAQRLLLDIMSEHQFGRLENVPVQGGQPVLDSGVNVVRIARLGGETCGATVPSTDQFELKQAVCDLFDELARFENGTIAKLEFRHGLPWLMEIAIPATDTPANRPQSIEPRGQA
jgi:hypothetical protein